MNQQLRQAKQAIRTFIRAHFDDQRLHEVIAFNDDGKMEYSNICCCLLGVTLSSVLHTDCEVSGLSRKHHYNQATDRFDPIAAEDGYWLLGVVGGKQHISSDDKRARRLSAILKAESRRRHRIATKELAAPETVLVGESI